MGGADRRGGGGVSELPRPLGVALDCDGLLVDTEKLWSIAESEVFGRRGWDYTDELKAHFIGTSLTWTVSRMPSARVMTFLWGKFRSSSSVISGFASL